MQYCIINNDIALLMHYRALLQMPGYVQVCTNCTTFIHSSAILFDMRQESRPQNIYDFGSVIHKLFSSMIFNFFSYLFFYISTAYGLSDANAYILVFDLLCPDSFDYVSGMYSQIADGRNLSRVPVVNIPMLTFLQKLLNEIKLQVL